MNDIDNFLKIFDYDKPKIDAKYRQSIVDVIPNNKRCGIYVLHFANGEYYIGLSVNVCSRYVQHLKTYDDIKYISFKQVALAKLRQEEERLIKKTEKAGFPLRNKVHASVTVASSPFDEIMDEHARTNWLNHLTTNDFDGERLVDADLRRKYNRNYRRLLDLPHSNDAIDVFRAYVTKCIPAPFRTELYYWSASCLPGRSNSLYIRVNIKQEVLRIWKVNDEIEYVFFVARSKYETDNVLKNIFISGQKFLKFRAVSGGIGMYEAGGQDQIEVTIRGYENAMKALNDHTFIHAIRTLNLRIMRKTFNLQYKSHCYDLADHALEQLYD